jgi:hypothetical protein
MPTLLSNSSLPKKYMIQTLKLPKITDTMRNTSIPPPKKYVSKAIIYVNRGGCNMASVDHNQLFDIVEYAYAE